LKIYEVEDKSSTSTSTSTQNIAFVSSSNTDSTNEPVSAVASVSAVSVKIHVSGLPNIDANDLEEMDLKWQMAMLTVRARRFLQRTGRNLGTNRPSSMGFDMSKVECYNCHRKGHFARKCRSPKDTRMNGVAEPQRKNVPVETSTSNALVSQCDGVGSYDWPSLLQVLLLTIRLLVYQQNESVFEEDIKLLKLEVQHRDNDLVVLRQNLDKAEEERDDLKFKLEKFKTSSKNLNDLLASQTNSKTGLGYNSQVFTRTCMPPKPDLVFHNAPNDVETVHTTFNFKRSPTKPDNDLSHTHRPSAPIIKDWVSDSEDESETKKPQNEIQVSNGLGPKEKLTILFLVQGNPQHSLKDKGVIDSECLRHITGNMSYLSDFEELNGGYVAFEGKFDGKVDEEFLVGYSVSSKAFRVFNSRTRIVEETLHIIFLENKPNVPGSGPTWMFDIDTLTKTMNYQPVTARNQSNSGAGVQEQIDAEKAGEKIVQQYVLFPIWSFGSTNPYNTDGDAAFDEKELEFEGKKPESEVNVSLSRYRNLSTKFEDFSYNSINEDNAAEADFNNLETSITVSPILTKRVHKDHPVTQIIRNLSSATQTRRMTRVAKDQGTEKVKRGIVFRTKARLIAQGHTQEEGIYYEESAFLDGTIKEEVYVCQPLGFKDTDYLDKERVVSTSSTEAEYAAAVVLSDMESLKRMLHVTNILSSGSLTTPQMVLNSSCLTHIKNWLVQIKQSLKVNDITRLQALVDKKKVVITEATIKDAVRLDDAEGVECLPNEEIFAELAIMGYEKPSTKLTFYKQVSKGAAEVIVKVVSTACVTAEGVASVPDDEVLAAVDKPSIPSPTPPTPPPQPSQDQPSTSQDKIAQALEIIMLKQRVKKLERRNKASKLKRLQKVGTAPRIETSDDTVMDDVSKQGRIIVDMDADDDVTLKYVAVIAKHDVDIEPAKLQEVVEVVTTAKLITEEEGVVIRDPEESATPSIIIHTEAKSKDNEVKRLNDVYTEATPLAFKVPFVDYEIYTKNNKPYYKIKRADGSDQLYMIFLSMLRNFDREDLEVLCKLVKERFASTKPKNFSDEFLLTTLGALFEKTDIQAQIWKNQRSVHGQAKVKSWKLLESYGPVKGARMNAHRSIGIELPRPGESSHATPLERQEDQIKTILNHLDELLLKRIKEMEDKIRGLRNGRVIIKQDFDKLETELEDDFYSRNDHRGYLGSPPIRYKESSRSDPMPPKRTSTSLASTMTQVAIKKLVADSVATALEAQAANMANADTEPREAPIARTCS
nr:ribonuclease H-like domain-containing protein [Tanacetum cinerariifolium]